MSDYYLITDEAVIASMATDGHDMSIPHHANCVEQDCKKCDEVWAEWTKERDKGATAVTTGNTQDSTLETIEALLKRIGELEAQLHELAQAAMRYDAAIYRRAGSTAAQDKWADTGYKNTVLVAGYDLDALYFDWLEKSRLALEANAAE